MNMTWSEAKQFYSINCPSSYRGKTLLINRQVEEVSFSITSTDVESFPSVRRAVGKSLLGVQQTCVAL